MKATVLKRRAFALTPQDRIFTIVNYTLMIAMCITMLYPFLFLLVSSISKYDMAATALTLIPKEITWDYFARVLENRGVGTGYVNTLLRTVIGTFASVLVTFCLAYPLSKRTFPHRNFWTALIVFTMFFSGGVIPTYIVVRDLGLVNSFWSMILPELVSAYNFVIVRNYLQTIPPSLEESAKIDGANDITIMFRIILPVCKPILATIALWVAVWHWNAWFDAMLYISNADGQPVQLVMRRIVIDGSAALNQMIAESRNLGHITPDGLKAATIMVTTIPILLVYPFVQKYFVKGVMVGSLKG